MIISKSEFARICNVTRGAINLALDRKRIFENSEGKIDTDDPRNNQYILMRNPQAAIDLPTAIKQESKPPEPKKAKSENKKTEFKKPEKKQTQKTKKTKSIIDLKKYNAIKAIEESDDDEIQIPKDYKYDDEKMHVILDRAYFESLRIKHEAELKALKLDQENNELGERSIFANVLENLSQAIQKGFIDVLPKQSLLICSRLGCTGREAEVENLLAEDNRRRLEEIIRIVTDAKYLKSETKEDETE